MFKMIKQLRPFAFSIIAVIVFIFIQSLSELALPTLMADIVDKGIVNGDISYIMKVGIWMMLITAIGTISAILGSLIASRIGVGFGRVVRNKIFTKVEGFSLTEFDQLGTASLITRTTNDVIQLQNFIINSLRMMARAPIMAVGGIIMAISKDVKLSLILIGVVVVLAIGIWYVSKITIPLFKSIQKKIDKINLVMREFLTGIRVIRAFNRTNREKDRFYKANKELTDTSIKVNKIMATLMPLMTLMFNFTSIFIFWFGSKHVDLEVMQVGDLMAFIQYAMQIMFSLVMFTMMFIMIPRASVSAGRINEVLEMESEILELENPKVTASNMRGHIEFQNVSFCFEGAQEPVIQNVSFKCETGKVVAVIGRTGSGKSTLVNLIMRFYEVTKGRILIDGMDIKEMSQETLREKIGFVPQNATLFTGTVGDNIRFGNQSASDEEVKSAAETAQAMEFIENMKEGLGAEISQGGTNISGGQKQRLSIARALVRKPEIYIFDDSFSALDFKTEAKLRRTLKTYTKNDTILLVAQRVTTVMDADQIIVLEDGAVAGVGRHKTLMNDCQVYREIVRSQLSEEEII